MRAVGCHGGGEGKKKGAALGGLGRVDRDLSLDNDNDIVNLLTSDVDLHVLGPLYLALPHLTFTHSGSRGGEDGEDARYLPCCTRLYLAVGTSRHASLGAALPVPEKKPMQAINQSIN